MMNHIFYETTAQELAQKLIETEKDYLNTASSTLSFEEGCRLLLQNTATYHPLFRQMELGTLAASIYPELLRRAEANDPFALYCMAALNRTDVPRTESRLGYLERAVKAGSAEACIHYASRFLCDGTDTAYNLAQSLPARCAEEAKGKDCDELLFRCYDLLVECSKTDEERAHYQALLDRLARKMVLDGSYRALPYLCVRDYEDKGEKAFWKQTAFLARSYFYEQGATHLGDLLKRSDRSTTV